MGCRSLLLTAALLLAGCNGEIYLRDGVTDGDTFYLAERALHDRDPVLQSWVSYSLMKSACQLEIGGENPARATSFECELKAREHLLETWSERPVPGNGDNGERYLDELQAVQHAGLLREYVWHYWREPEWHAPPDLDLDRFQEWRHRHLAGHDPETRLIGSWGYAQPVGTAGGERDDATPR